ncbi:MAG: hypothetical protein ACE5JQ_09250 [Candidatus Methylomirabilales bacterium]
MKLFYQMFIMANLMFYTALAVAILGGWMRREMQSFVDAYRPAIRRWAMVRRARLLQWGEGARQMLTAAWRPGPSGPRAPTARRELSGDLAR